MENFDIPTTSILNGFVSGQWEVCCLCLKSLGHESYRSKDKIVSNENKTETLVEIVGFVLGQEIADTMSILDALCEHCTRSTLNSYSFMKLCQQNHHKLNQMVDKLTNCFENTIDCYKTLFIGLNNDDFDCKQYYDDKLFISKNEALDRFQALTSEVHPKPDIEIELEINIIDTEDCKETYIEQPESKVKKRNSIGIKTCDMMYDKNDSTFKCKECFKIFPKSNNLRQHYMRVHAPKDFKCSECPRSFGSEAILEQHKYESHSTVVCSECGKTYYNRYSLKLHELGHKLKFVCQMCGRVYKRRRTFEKHQSQMCNQTRKSNAEAKLTCDYCNKKYCHRPTLISHIRFEHGDAQAHVCTWCNKKFQHLSKLKSHMVKHTKEKNFSCNKCGGKFVTKESLLYHTRTHTGVKPYKCDHCDLRFLSTSRRADHVRHHHMDPTVECDICHSKFKARSGLLRHRKRHFNPNSRLHFTQLPTQEE